LPPPAAAPPPDLAALRSLVACGNSHPLATETATRFLNPLRRECGAEHVVGTPTPRESWA